MSTLLYWDSLGRMDEREVGCSTFLLKLFRLKAEERDTGGASGKGHVWAGCFLDTEAFLRKRTASAQTLHQRRINLQKRR